MNNISDIVISVLEHVELSDTNMPVDKKTMAIDLINEKINELPDDDFKSAMVSSINIVDELIDVIILASKNKLKINRKFKKLFCCLK